MDSEEILSQLRTKGYKVTAYRRALLELFFKEERPVSVGDILDILLTQKMKPNKTTIYREIESLVKLGYVNTLDLGDERKRYELSSRQHHHHLICEQCESIEDIVIKNDIHEIEKKVKSKSKFKIKSHTLEFFGLCPNCQ